MSYQSIQFAPDGEYITDYHEQTVEEVWKRVNDQGSRWYFYPFPFVITDGGSGIDRKRIVSCPDGYEFFEGCTVSTVAREIHEYAGMV